MTNPEVWAEIQQPGAIASYVLPLMIGSITPKAEHVVKVEWVAGTGFLLAGGRGLGVTARHVVKNLLKDAPLGDPWLAITVDTEPFRLPMTSFVAGPEGSRPSPIITVDLHPTEDVALFRLADQALYSPYTFSADPHGAAGEYSLWGYPDEVRHDQFAEGSTLLNVPLVYSAGHIRRRLTGDIPDPGPFGQSFYELSAPAGQCCSGAPVSIRHDPWRAIGVYVGERRQPDSGFAVGYATRAEDLGEHWPQLFGPPEGLTELCPLPPNMPPLVPPAA